MTDQPIATWEGLTAQQLAQAWGAPAVHLFGRVGSTSDVARRLAAEGALAGTLALAEEQRSGRGRMGRAWASPPGLGLWLSLVARPAAGGLSVLPLLVGLAAAEALDSFAPAGTVGIKWPNDLEVGGRKLGGVLCEASWEGERLTGVVVGVGLNLLHRGEHFPEELRERATSLSLALGRPVDRLAVASALVPALLHAIQTSPPEEWQDRLRRRDVLQGREVLVTDPVSGAPLARGQADGITADGALLLRTTDGAQRAIHSGTIRLAEAG